MKKLQPRACNILNNLLSQYPGKCTHSLYSTLEGSKLDMDRAIPLGLVVNEAVTNILKHAFPGQTEGAIKVTLHEGPQGKSITIEDNGQGFSPGTADQSADGLGLKLMEILAQQAGTHLSVDSEAGKGTRVRLLLL